MISGPAKSAFTRFASSRAYSSSSKAAQPVLSASSKKLIAGSVVLGSALSYYTYSYGIKAEAMYPAEHGLHPPEYNWSHNGMFAAESEHLDRFTVFHPFRFILSLIHKKMSRNKD